MIKASSTCKCETYLWVSLRTVCFERLMTFKIYSMYKINLGASNSVGISQQV